MGRSASWADAPVEPAAPAALPVDPASAAPPADDLQARFDALAAEKLLQDAALAEAHAALAEAREELKRQREGFESAWSEREEHFRSEHNALAAEVKLAEAAAAVIEQAPKARRAAATFTLLVEGVRKTFRAGDPIPDTADLSTLPAWAFEAA
jgi:phosphoenolpyruvate-protein kinase (PTS system EI component)